VSRRLLPLLLVAIGVSGCTLTLSRDAVNPTPVLVSVTQGIQTCGDVIQAALEQPYCTDGNAVCYAAAEYNPQTPTNNVISRGVLGSLENIDDVAMVQRRNNRVENSTTWESYALYVQQDEIDLVLYTLGDVTLANITPSLDELTLTVETTNDTVCAQAPDPGLILQSNGAENAVSINGAGITIGKTVVIQQSADAMILASLDDLTVVSADGVTRVIRAGEQVTISLEDDSIAGEPSPAVPYNDDLLRGLPLDQLPVPLTFDQLPAEIQIERLQDGEGCVVNPAWNDEYIIQRGDTLSRIASLYDLTVQELQLGNCLQNPNRLDRDQVLRVPGEATPTPTVPPTPTAIPTVLPLATTRPSTTPNLIRTATPSPATGNSSNTVAPAADDERFTVDALGAISPGDCTYLRWEIDNATQVLLDGASVALRAGQEVCPQITTVYSLQVIYTNGTQETINRAVVVGVNGG
jgi:LysM repeat protein